MSQNTQDLNTLKNCAIQFGKIYKRSIKCSHTFICSFKIFPCVHMSIHIGRANRSDMTTVVASDVLAPSVPHSSVKHTLVFSPKINELIPQKNPVVQMTKTYISWFWGEHDKTSPWLTFCLCWHVNSVGRKVVHIGYSFRDLVSFDAVRQSYEMGPKKV